MKTVRILIKGHVQGVYFRASAKEAADAWGIAGWVRNTAEGHVEIVAKGEAEAMDAFVAWCHRGPASAVVHHVDLTPMETSQEFSGFRIQR